MGMPQSVLPDVESAACTTPVEANMQTSSGQPRGAVMISRSGSDSESPSEAVASAEAEVAGRCGFGTGAAECAGGGSAGIAEVCAGVHGSEPECEISNRKKTPRSQIDVFAKGLKRHRNGLHRQLRASVLRRAGPQSGQYCRRRLRAHDAVAPSSPRRRPRVVVSASPRRRPRAIVPAPSSPRLSSILTPILTSPHVVARRRPSSPLYAHLAPLSSPGPRLVIAASSSPRRRRRVVASSRRRCRFVGSVVVAPSRRRFIVPARCRRIVAAPPPLLVAATPTRHRRPRVVPGVPGRACIVDAVYPHLHSHLHPHLHPHPILTSPPPRRLVVAVVTSSSTSRRRAVVSL